LKNVNTLLAIVPIHRRFNYTSKYLKQISILTQAMLQIHVGENQEYVTSPYPKHVSKKKRLVTDIHITVIDRECTGYRQIS